MLTNLINTELNVMYMLGFMCLYFMCMFVFLYDV